MSNSCLTVYLNNLKHIGEEFDAQPNDNADGEGGGNDSGLE